MADRLDEIQARVEAATPGPWEWDSDLCVMLAGYEGQDPVVGVRLSPRSFDADFIAHSREDVPFLLAEVTKFRAIIEEAANTLRATLDHENEVQEARNPQEDYETYQGILAAWDILAKATPEGGTK